MGAGDSRIIFVDQAGTEIQESIMPSIPRVGDHVDLYRVRVAGVVDQVTWQVGDLNANSRVFVRLRPQS
jgi:hypothetical protein